MAHQPRMIHAFTRPTMRSGHCLVVMLLAILSLLLHLPISAARKLNYHNALPNPAPVKPKTTVDGHIVKAQMRQIVKNHIIDPTTTTTTTTTTVAPQDGTDGTTTSKNNYAIPPSSATSALENPYHASHNHEWPSYLSATVLIKLGPVDGVMDSARQAMLSMAVTLFLEKIFHAQTKYDISVRNVGVIEQGIASMPTRSTNRGGGRRMMNDKLVRRRRQTSNPKNVVEVESVITAQYYTTDESSPIITTEEFAKMLEHVFDKFELNLVDILKEQEGGEDWNSKAPYFGSIEFVSIEVRTGGSTMGILPSNTSSSSSSSSGVGVAAIDNSGGSPKRMKTVGITALVFSGFALVALSVIVYRRRYPNGNPKLAFRYKPTICKDPTEEAFNIQSIAHIGREDTYSFSSQGHSLGVSVPSVNSFTKKHLRKSERKKSKRGVQPLTFEDKISKFDLSSKIGKRDQRSVASSTRSVSSTKSKNSYTRVKSDTVAAEYGEIETETLGTMRSECYAPPGKLGVAIDTINGQPVVHRIKEGSPLRGILKHRDRIVAIDGVNTRNMSAADVTHLMVKGMNRVRKISYVRAQNGRH